MSRIAPISTAYQNLLANGRLQPNPAQLELVTQLGRLQQALLRSRVASWTGKNDQYQNGLYIYGGVGTGKSRIADLFAATLPNSIRCRRIHFHQFMEDVHTRLHHARSQLDYAGDPLMGIGRTIKSESPVLCFDEFQVSDIADAMILKRLFGSFWQAGGLMVSTSNRHPDELYLNGLNRSLFVPFIKDLQQRCLVWKMQGEYDYRMEVGSQRIPIFFIDAKAFDQALLETIGETPLVETRLKVAMNRSITVRAAFTPTAAGQATNSKAVISGTFSQLCEASLGTSDYHALCNTAHTIFLSGLRTFATNELDFVRRFITLIDIAYEYRTRIVCLSDAPLTDVFQHIGISENARSAVQTIAGDTPNTKSQDLTVTGKGGSSSSMMSTFIGEMEWSATGLAKASLATNGAGEVDVRFAVGRAISRLSEMGLQRYGVIDA